jgi:hypothetical protein
MYEFKSLEMTLTNSACAPEKLRADYTEAILATIHFRIFHFPACNIIAKTFKTYKTAVSLGAV